MIKALQKRFVVTAMLAITILLVLLLGTINAVNIGVSRSQINTLIDELSIGENSLEIPPPKIPDDRGGPFDPKPSEDSKMSSVFFTVEMDDKGNTVRIDISRIASITEDEAAEIAAQVMNYSKQEGRFEQFRYKITASQFGNGATMVFLDTSVQTLSLLRVLLLSVIIGIACWLLMLVLVMLLSRRAIRPIAANFERQKQFVTDAGHEIKTPLAIILANTDAMELHNGENKWSGNIKEQVVRLNGLMQNLLTLSKIDEIKVSLSKEALDLSDIAEQTADMFDEAMGLKNITLEKHIQPGVIINAERELISRLFSILLDNAVKYSKQDGKISLEVYRNDKKATLIVANTCEELPACPPDKLFDRFYRADAARTQTGGYGIGLSAAKSITDAHSGSITAEYYADDVIAFRVKI